MKLRQRKRRLATRSPYAALFSVTAHPHQKVRSFLQRMADQLPKLEPELGAAHAKVRLADGLPGVSSSCLGVVA